MQSRLLAVAIAIGALAACDKQTQAAPTSAGDQASAATIEQVVPPAPAPKSYAGPFGLDAGLSLKEVEKLVPLDAGDEPGVYMSSQVPEPHPAFESYSLVFSDSTGLCKIVAIGKDISTGDSGFEVRSAFSDLSDAIAKKYGKGKKYDFYSGGGSGRSEYWMMNLAGKDRTLATSWTAESGATLPETIQAISISANATRMDNGYLLLTYEFSNFDLCVSEIKSEKNSVL